VTDYDKIAETFSAKVDALPGNQHYERPATIALLPPLKGLDVLDAGCGSGFYVDHCHRAGARVVGFDPSVEMVKEARKRIGKRCMLIHCSSAELHDRLGDKTFDLILSNLVMHYVEDMTAELRLLVPELKPGGRILLSMKHPLMNGAFIQEHGFRASGPVELDWEFAGGTVTHIQRPLGAITESIYEAGLLIERLVEALPEEEMATKSPAGYRLAMRKPFFIHFILRPR